MGVACRDSDVIIIRNQVKKKKKISFFSFLNGKTAKRRIGNEKVLGGEFTLIFSYKLVTPEEVKGGTKHKGKCTRGVEFEIHFLIKFY